MSDYKLDFEKLKTPGTFIMLKVLPDQPKVQYGVTIWDSINERSIYVRCVYPIYPYPCRLTLDGEPCAKERFIVKLGVESGYHVFDSEIAVAWFKDKCEAESYAAERNRMETCDEFHGVWLQDLLADRATLLAEVERLRKALVEYAVHHSHCVAADRICTCGLIELLQ